MKKLKCFKQQTQVIAFSNFIKPKILCLALGFLLLFFQFVYNVGIVLASNTSITIPNSSFELTTQKTSFGITYIYPTDWTFTSMYSIESSSEYAISGNSAKIINSSNFTLESARFSVSSGQYDFGFYCYAQTDTIEASIQVCVLDDAGYSIRTFTSQPCQVSAGSWQKIYVSASLDQPNSDVKLIITTNNKNSACYIDEVFCEPQEQKTFVSTLYGATMRLNIQSPGIRFRGTVDKDFYDDCLEKYTDVSAGMLFTVQENLDGLSDFTVEQLSTHNRIYKEITAVIWNNPDTIETDGFYGFNCAIVDIKDKNIGKTYCARSYVKYTDNGVVKYVYGEFSYSNNARTIIEIANAVLKSDQTFSDKVIEILEHFAFYKQTNILNTKPIKDNYLLMY